jgi:uncharacterized DUF497 family protein
MEFDWDEHNTKHLRAHRVSRHEFEEVLCGEPLDLDYQVENGEERYKALGMTQRGRVLIVVWTPRDGRARAITAYSAGATYKKLFRKIRT